MTFGQLAHVGLGIAAWGVMAACVLLASYATWMVVIAFVVLGEGPSSSDVLPVVVPVLAAMTLIVALLVARFISSPRRVATSVVFMLAIVWGAQAVRALSSLDWALYQARAAAWGESDVNDYQKFPQRAIANGTYLYNFPQAGIPLKQEPIEYQSGGQSRQAPELTTFLKSTETTSFIVIKDGQVRYEAYSNGYSRDSIVTSFSVAKSFISALAGIAIEEGYIGSVDDRITLYLPELRGKGLDNVTILHLLTMSSGIHFTDGDVTYYHPALRSRALRRELALVSASMLQTEECDNMSPKARRWQAWTKTQIPLSQLVKSFLMYQEDRNHSPKTVEWYEGMLGRFNRFLGENAKAGELDLETVRRYQRFLRGEGLSKFTLHAYSRTLKTFLRWLGREAYIDKDLWHEVEMPKVPSYDDVTLDVLDDDEIRKLLDLLNPSTDVGCRDRGMVCLMLESGLRLDEVVKLRIEDVHLKEGYVKVRGKGDKEAYVPVGSTTKKALERYQEHFRVPRNGSEHAFFLNIFGEPISYSAVQSSFVRLAKRSGISRLHPHLLRHTAATRMLSNGADLHTVQRLLRHSDVRVTLRYLHLIPQQLQERMQLFSPLNGLEDNRRRMAPKRNRFTPSATGHRPRKVRADD